MKKLETLLYKILFFACFLLGALAVLERALNFLGYTLLRGYYAPFRLLEFSAVGLLFVIVLQLRQIQLSLNSKGAK